MKVSKSGSARLRTLEGRKRTRRASTPKEASAVQTKRDFILFVSVSWQRMSGFMRVPRVIDNVVYLKPPSLSCFGASGPVPH